MPFHFQVFPAFRRVRQVGACHGPVGQPGGVGGASRREDAAVSTNCGSCFWVSLQLSGVHVRASTLRKPPHGVTTLSNNTVDVNRNSDMPASVVRALPCGVGKMSIELPRDRR